MTIGLLGNLLEIQVEELLCQTYRRRLRSAVATSLPECGVGDGPPKVCSQDILSYNRYRSTNGPDILPSA
jgi:hypothetical protein